MPLVRSRYHRHTPDVIWSTADRRPHGFRPRRTPAPAEDDHVRRRLGGRPESPGPRDPRLRTAVVEVRRRQGAGDPGAVRHVGHPLLPGAQRADRHPGRRWPPTRCWSSGCAGCGPAGSVSVRPAVSASRFDFYSYRHGPHRTAARPRAGGLNDRLGVLLLLVGATVLVIAVLALQPPQGPAGGQRDAARTTADAPRRRRRQPPDEARRARDRADRYEPPLPARRRRRAVHARRSPRCRWSC